jgi:serine/threonine protein kinase
MSFYNKSLLQLCADQMMKLEHQSLECISSATISDSSLSLICSPLDRVYLTSNLKDYGAFDPSQIQIYLLKVIEVLVYLHLNGSYHGDLSCANVCLDALG